MRPFERITNQTILLSPLDWGFGHTTRCVTIIKSLLSQNNHLIFAGNTAQNKFIKSEFPDVQTEFISGYTIELSSKKSTYFQLISQTPKLIKAIKKEQQWVLNFIKNQSVDLIISDNRYGFRHQNIESIFMGHQLNIEAPHFKSIASKSLLHYINQFNKCWIVDDEIINLAGRLSRPEKLTIPFEYTGFLNRFTVSTIENAIDYLIIISGPHPENKLFLSQIEALFKKANQRITIVSSLKSNSELAHINYAYNPSTLKLNQLLNDSKCIVSRAGYTTLMEFYPFNKKVILIPTKGQFEQEYLAKHIKHFNFDFIDSVSDFKF